MLAAPANPRRVGTNGARVAPIADCAPLAIFIHVQRLSVDRIDHERSGRGKVARGFHVGPGQPFVVEDSARRLVAIERDQLVAAQFDRRLTILLRELAADAACGRGGSESRDGRQKTYPSRRAAASVQIAAISGGETSGSKMSDRIRF